MMLKCQKNKFWLENIVNLVCNFSVVPLQGMGLAEQMNALTRLVLVIFLVLLLLDFKYSLLFLLLSLLFIIILYYIQRNQMEQYRAENYSRPEGKKVDPAHIKAMKILNNPSPGFKRLMVDGASSCRFCDDAVPLDGPKGAFNNPNYMSVSQRLVGPPNPKTLIAPVVTPPPLDLSYWRANNLVTHSHVNAESQVQAYQSGYQVSTCCPPNMNGFAHPVRNPLDYEVPVQEEITIPRKVMKEPFGKDHAYWNKPKTRPPGGCKSQLYPSNMPGQTKEEFRYTFPFLKTAPQDGDINVLPNASGWVNTACGYNPDQLFKAGLPTNEPAGNCPQDPAMKQYNDNLYTQTIQPGIYTRNQINEPVNANIGISYTQQFPPTTCETNPKTGGLNYTEHDPRIIEPAIVEPNLSVLTAATEANIYDPRFSGYGTSYRAYTDENLGQTRFYYDDVDAIRMPNYIVRSNIDHQPFADSYGPIPEGDAHGNKWTGEIRSLANGAFTDGALQFRTDLQERLMRKANAKAWQQRQKPINSSSQRPMGGIARIF